MKITCKNIHQLFLLCIIYSFLSSKFNQIYVIIPLIVVHIAYVSALVHAAYVCRIEGTVCFSSNKRVNKVRKLKKWLFTKLIALQMVNKFFSKNVQVTKLIARESLYLKRVKIKELYDFCNKKTVYQVRCTLSKPPKLCIVSK